MQYIIVIMFPFPLTTIIHYDRELVFSTADNRYGYH